MRSAVAYARVSTQAQGRSGLGLDAQVATINAFAAEAGFRIVERFVEVETGKGAAAAAALKAARKVDKSCPVIVAKLDRLSRDVHLRLACREGAPPHRHRRDGPRGGQLVPHRIASALVLEAGGEYRLQAELRAPPAG